MARYNRARRPAMQTRGHASKEASVWWNYKPYVSVAERRANAALEIRKLEKKGHKALPVHIEGKAIASTFWGKAWCDNLESYSDFSNRLPRGRTYVRNGSVCDLQISPGEVSALVCGSELYRIDIAIKALAADSWNGIKKKCAGQIASVIELLQGKISHGVMEIITHPNEGLFPMPEEIDLACSCPDSAEMCKHVAAALYGVGARLDEQPELLFLLRQVDHLELITEATDIKALKRGEGIHKTIDMDSVADVFGIELEADFRNVDKPSPKTVTTKRPKGKAARPVTSSRATGALHKPIAKAGRSKRTSSRTRSAPPPPAKRSRKPKAKRKKTAFK